MLDSAVIVFLLLLGGVVSGALVAVWSYLFFRLVFGEEEKTMIAADKPVNISFEPYERGVLPFAYGRDHYFIATNSAFDKAGELDLEEFKKELKEAYKPILPRGVMDTANEVFAVDREGMGENLP